MPVKFWVVLQSWAMQFGKFNLSALGGSCIERDGYSFILMAISGIIREVPTPRALWILSVLNLYLSRSELFSLLGVEGSLKTGMVTHTHTHTHSRCVRIALNLVVISFFCLCMRAHALQVGVSLRLRLEQHFRHDLVDLIKSWLDLEICHALQLFQITESVCFAKIFSVTFYAWLIFS